jgi:TonB family protein
MRAGRRRLLYAALLAVGLHVDLALIFVLLLHGGTFGRLPDPTFDDAISLETIDPAEAQAMLAEIDRAEEEARKKEEESPQAPGQVVELPEPAIPERPDKARFVAEHDSKVERETRRTAPAQDPGPAPRPPAPALLAMRAPSPPAAAPPTGGPPAAPVPPGVPAPPTTMRGPAFDPDGALTEAPAVGTLEPQPPQQSRASKDAPSDQPNQRRPIALTPSSMQLARAIGGGTPDHLVDVDEGPGTSLNAKQWKFASFFNRVKRQVAQHWRPGEQYGKRDPTGNIYGSGQWVTLLQVMLKPDGSLASVNVAKPSGLEFLDDEAVEAIKRGQPYPNPPPQLVSEGVVGFRFGFFFDVEGSPRMKVYRYSGL